MVVLLTRGRPPGTPEVSFHSADSQPLPLRFAAMTDNTANKDETDAGSGSALATADSLDERADLPDEDIEIDDDPADLTEMAREDSGGAGVPGTGALSGGF